MTRTAREAIVVPWMLLTVALAAGLRVTLEGELRFLVPTLSSLVAMLLLLTVFARTGIVRPALLIGEQRTAIENLNGCVVLIALAAASAQIIAAVTPEAGLPLVLGVIFLFALFANTLAAAPRRGEALRALFVAFFAAFSVKFIVLDALYAPDRGLGGKLLTGLLEGITLGSLDHVVWAPATGYVIFLMLVLYFGALVLIPVEPSGGPGGLTSPRASLGSSRSSSSDLLQG